MSRNFKIAVGLLLPVSAAVLCYLPFSPGFWLKSNMAAAQAHLPKVQAVIDEDPRFKYVALAADQEFEGSVYVSGVIPPGTKEDLKRLVESTTPPRPVFWQVEEVPPGFEFPEK